MLGNEIRLLGQKALDYAIDLSQYQLDLFQSYLDELWAWNQRMNLTGLSTRNRIVIELFLDSLLLAPFVPDRGRLLDVGSGAGIPGVPLKIYRPLLKTHLLESNSKKVSFLKRVIRLLGLKDMRAIRGRIEKDGDLLHSDGYQIITARALGPLDRTIGWCAPYMCAGGLLVSFSGGRVREDLAMSERAMAEHGVVMHKAVPYLLPGKKSKRHILIFK